MNSFTVAQLLLKIDGKVKKTKQKTLNSKLKRKRCNEPNFETVLAYDRTHIMVQGKICLAAYTDFVVISGGNLPTNSYIIGILEEHLQSSAPFIGDDYILMPDNARPHTVV